MHGRLDVLFKSADDAVKEPWESPQRGLGCLVMWLNISSLLTTNVQHSLSSFFLSLFLYLVWLPLRLCSSDFLCSIRTCSSLPPLLHQKHSSHMYVLALKQSDLVRLYILYVCQSSHYYRPIPKYPFCVANNPYPKALSCGGGMKGQTILRLTSWRQALTWFIHQRKRKGYWKANMMARCLYFF